MHSPNCSSSTPGTSPEMQSLSLPRSTETEALGWGLDNTEGRSPTEDSGARPSLRSQLQRRETVHSPLSIHPAKTLRLQNQQAGPAQGQFMAPIQTDTPASLTCHFQPPTPRTNLDTRHRKGQTPEAVVFPAWDEAQCPAERLGGCLLQTRPAKAMDSPTPPDSSMPCCPGVT